VLPAPSSSSSRPRSRDMGYMGYIGYIGYIDYAL
jgi:hypothetical protein